MLCFYCLSYALFHIKSIYISNCEYFCLLASFAAICDIQNSIPFCLPLNSFGETITKERKFLDIRTLNIIYLVVVASQWGSTEGSVPLLCCALCTGVVLNQQNMSTAGIFRFSFLAIRLLTIQAINRFIRVCWNIQMLHCFPVLAIPDRDIMSHNKMDDVVMTQYDSDKNSTCIWIEFLAYLICRHYHLPARRCGHEALPPHAF